MSKMQTDNHNFRKNVITEKGNILGKMSLKFLNCKSDISCKIAFYIFFATNWNSLELRGQWGTSVSGWVRFYASVS